MKRFLGQIAPAIYYGILWRGWQLVAVPAMLYLISVRFSPELQGYHYTFASLLALQSFFELGLFLVILNITAHEWAGLRLNANKQVIGDINALSRLVSLGRFVFKYFSLASVVFFVTVSTIGYIVFSRQGDSAVTWRWPWLLLTALAALNILGGPFCSLLEGCNQVAQVYKMRIWQAVTSGIVGWTVIFFGGGLWSSVAILTIQVGWVAWFLLINYNAFFSPFFRPPAGEVMSWRQDIWPMQWRLACSGVVNYFGSSLFVPVMFHYHGAVIAGQMGMTLQIIGGIQTVSSIWLTTKLPRFGVLIARREYSELDRLWFGATIAFVAIYTVGAVGVYVVAAGGRYLEFSLVHRVLPLVPLAGFLTAGLIMNFSQSMSSYLRAHKKEPLLVMSVSISVLIGAVVIALGKTFGASGAAWGYAASNFLGGIWLLQIWRRSRLDWHRPVTEPVRNLSPVSPSDGL